MLLQIWTINPPGSGTHDTSIHVEGEGDVMLYALSKLVAIPTVSDEAHRERYVCILVCFLLHFVQLVLDFLEC